MKIKYDDIYFQGNDYNDYNFGNAEKVVESKSTQKFSIFKSIQKLSVFVDKRPETLYRRGFGANAFLQRNYKCENKNENENKNVVWNSLETNS